MRKCYAGGGGGSVIVVVVIIVCMVGTCIGVFEAMYGWKVCASVMQVEAVVQ